MMRRLLPLWLVLPLAACDAPQDDLEIWMKETRASVSPPKTNVEAPKKVEPFAYSHKDALDPFSQAKLTVAMDRAGKAKQNSGLAPDAKRPREVLENFPLESIRMVGRIADAKATSALLQVNSAVYMARVGNYAGQNFGRIIRIGDNEVLIKELVQDASGDWVEREASLKLQEGDKK